MPITLFHFGPGALINAAAPRDVSWTMFALANIAIDLEPILFFLVTGDPIHPYLHTLTGATLLALVCGTVGRPLCELWLRGWNRQLSRSQARWLGSEVTVTRRVALVSALIGTWSHLALDVVMHADVQVLWPWIEGNALRGVIPLDALHQLCIVTGALGLLWLAARRVWPQTPGWNPSWFIEYGRPWNQATFVAGLGLLIVGSFHYQFSDWDVGVSIVMALATYLTAPWSLTTLVQCRWRWMPLAVFYAWLSVDGVYWVWHTLSGNEMLREAQWQTSVLLWLMCGVIWFPYDRLRTIREPQLG